MKLLRSCQDIDQESLERLIRYTWPGNVRELENVIERAMILSINLCCGSTNMSWVRRTPPSLRRHQPASKDLERRHILQTLTLTNWHIEGPDGAAVRLGIPPSTLRSRMKQFGMTRPPSS